ncbi:type II secretion system F family protein [Paenibacillus thermoaerophilus]|uniref:Type II secretion system F family protein n=1 Tax=Paenibacillus thermoaerophilus TaxID=1215385 RepID=A0ABW2V3V8_9BACL|nr:type II secretion system F family protein [Paenibacillus thermoaerophilus]TMV17146.1 type II secretion system F family protein [Paenibacillus thermoaerophilus]
MDRWKTWERKTIGIWSVLAGEQQASELAGKWRASVVRETVLVLAAAVAVLIAADPAAGAALLVLAGGWPWVRYRMLDRKLTERRHDIVRELPEFLNRLVLLLNAGEPVQQAFRSAAERYGQRGDSALGKELSGVLVHLQNRMPFPAALEWFHQRCATPEVSMLTTTLLLNMRRGGQELTLTLRELSRNLWEKRKALALIRGEQASSKLIFPLMLMFAAVLLIVAAPALMSLS